MWRLYVTSVVGVAYVEGTDGSSHLESGKKDALVAKTDRMEVLHTQILGMQLD